MLALCPLPFCSSWLQSPLCSVSFAPAKCFLRVLSCLVLAVVAFCSRHAWSVLCVVRFFAMVVGLVVLVPGPPQWSGVLCSCLAHRGRRACCAGVRPTAVVECAILVCGLPQWSGVVHLCLALPPFFPRFFYLLCWRGGVSSFGRCRCVPSVRPPPPCLVGALRVSRHYYSSLFSPALCPLCAQACFRLAAIASCPPPSPPCLCSAGIATPLWRSVVLCSCLARRSGGACCVVLWPGAMVKCSVGAWPAAVVLRAMMVLGPLRWLRVLCSCLARLSGPVCCALARPTLVVMRGVLVLGPPSWSRVVCLCLVALLVSSRFSSLLRCFSLVVVVVACPPSPFVLHRC